MLMIIILYYIVGTRLNYYLNMIIISAANVYIHSYSRHIQLKSLLQRAGAVQIMYKALV